MSLFSKVEIFCLNCGKSEYQVPKGRQFLCSKECIDIFEYKYARSILGKEYTKENYNRLKNEEERKTSVLYKEGFSS